jgi:hypothetical protein
MCVAGDPSRFHAMYVVVCVPPCDAYSTGTGPGMGSDRADCTDTDANCTGTGSSSGTGSGRTETSLTGRQIAAYGRLANNVQKAMLLCSEDESGELCIVSLQWTGMS